jgi:hypothetical protein
MSVAETPTCAASADSVSPQRTVYAPCGAGAPLDAVLLTGAGLVVVVEAVLGASPAR